jgi:serine/threonine-protein kinase
MVGDYRIVEKLGAGGFSTVFKAERAGLFFTVKMLRSSALGARERREISILLQLEHPCVVRFRACDRWLDPKTGIPYIVTDFVPGRTLADFVEVENPSARTSVRILVEAARTLGEVHLQGVFHRDLKPENIIIHGENERPVLIDFGVGTYTGAPVITPLGVPPGTYEYRSPEAYLFNRANTDLAHYEFSAADELWALGVTFYWLLANVLPFGDRNDRERAGLADRIIHQRPMAPHLLNPRVPRALSDICMKMLEKKPEDRYASVGELCEALSGAMADAKADPRWDLPLFDPDAPDTGTTEEDPASVQADEDEETRMVRKWARAQPRRGRKPGKAAESAPDPDDVPPLVSDSKPKERSPVEARPEAEADAPRVDVPGALEALKRPALVLGLAAVVLGVFLFAWLPRPSPGVAPLHTSAEAPPTQQAGFRHEMATTEKPLDFRGGEGAEPVTDSTPAPVMSTMIGKDQNSNSEKPQEKTKVLGRVGKTLGTAAACAALSGCTAAPHVRATPEPPAPCPAGAVETMKALGIKDGELHVALFPTPKNMYLTVREGDTTLLTALDWGKLPDDTRLFGRLIFGEGRVYGRFTEAKTPGGETYKVCLEMYDMEGGRGAEREPAESARVFSNVYVRAVSSFE